MQVLFITQNEAPFRMKWMDELAKYIDVTVFHVGEYQGEVNPKFINYKLKRAHSLNISRMIFTKKIFRYSVINSQVYDLLILDGYGFFAQQLLLFKLKLAKKKYVISVDGGFIPKNENKLKKAVKKFFMSGALAYLSTSAQTDEFIKYYAGKKVIIYRHLFSSLMSKDIKGAATFEEKTRLRKNLKLEDCFTIIAVGRFLHIKGFDILLRAIEDVTSNVHVIIIGANRCDRYKEFLNARNRDKVTFIDFCDSSTLEKYYKASDIFVLPTRGDVWGLVVGEAMAYGLPIITTYRCLAGVAMIKNNINGFLVESESSSQLAETIEILANDPGLCHQMSVNNVELIKRYAIDNAVKDDIKNFSKIIKNSIELS